jgi:hypothetical protein
MSKRSLSIRFDEDLLARAERLAQPSENRSSLRERLVKASVDAAEEEILMSQYAEGYRRLPPTELENAVLDAGAAAGFADVRAAEKAAGLPVIGGAAAYQAWKMRRDAAG